LNNKLTQSINEKGELISIENMNTQEKTLGVNASLEEIRKELFEEPETQPETQPETPRDNQNENNQNENK